MTRFRELGGRHIYLVLNQEDIWPNMTGPAVLVKVEPKGNSEGLSNLLQGLHLPSALGAPRLLTSDLLCISYQPVFERLKGIEARGPAGSGVSRGGGAGDRQRADCGSAAGDQRADAAVARACWAGIRRTLLRAIWRARMWW